LFYTISGTRYFPEEKVSYLQKDIADLARRIGVQPVRSVGQVSAFEMMKVLHEPPADYHWKAGDGRASVDIFFLSIYEKLEELIDTMKSVATEFEYPVSDLGVYLQPIVQAVNYHCEFTLFFDRTDAGQKARVAALAEVASTALADRGAFFSRPYGPWAGMAYGRDPATAVALQKVKKIFDPNGLMNPGKLCF
jgi:FAD/FMN-containing dehydrogenase